jgi:hypothetical protein
MTRGIARLIVRATLLASVLSAGAGWAFPDTAALARAGAAASRPADAPAARGHRSRAVSKAPSGPALTSGTASPEGVADESARASPQGEVDPLVSNGLGSPLCKGVLGASGLPAASRRNCETSGFVAAPAPTGNYGIDVHIDTGVLGISSGGLLSIVQDLFVTPVWMALVWLVHAVVVMLEWCFTIDLLDSAAAGGIGSGLRQMETALTEPWLAIVLAIASVLALYNGLIRRRVAETLGQALLMTTMMVGGMWVIADPTGTVGALGQWANQASLGTLAVAARGTPAGAGGVLARSMDAVFAAAIEAPWCYLEFGDVAWCRDPARLDPQLRGAGLGIAVRELSLIKCKLGSDPFAPCVAPGSSQARAIEHSAELLREAQSNGAIFLALPANGPARNSINESGSLLRTMCQSSEATNCRGATAAQAQFRTNAGTWSRVGGLLLIGMGVLGMTLLLGFIALRLLAAAIFSLLYLLVAPGMVLAPALGEGGRAVFRRWVTQLLGAVVSKLVFSFLLGVVLAVLAVLSAMQALGWWTQWLLMSAFWWGAYMRRHQALGVAGGARGGEHAGRPRSLGHRMRHALESPRQAIAAARWVDKRLGGSPSSEEQPGRRPREGRQRRRAGGKRTPAARERARVGLERAPEWRDAQVRRTLEHDRRDAHARLEAAPAIRAGLTAKRSQLERVRRERAKAQAGGDARRAAELQHRSRRVAEQIQREQAQLDVLRRVAGVRRHPARRSHGGFEREQLRERGRFLDAQATLPRAAAAAGGSKSGRPTGERRDYPGLAGLAGYGRKQYERLAPGRQRAARVEIDRELALRGEMHGAATGTTPSGAPKIARRATGTSAKDLDDAIGGRVREGRYPAPGARAERPGSGSWREVPQPESSVMRDAREVAARRKRQLGRDRS